VQITNDWHVRCAAQSPIEFISPEMIGTGKPCGVARAFNHRKVAMSTNAGQGAQPTIHAPHDNDGFASDVDSEVVAWIADLFRPANTDPFPTENGVEFTLEALH